MTLRDTADQIIRASLRAVQPDAAVQRALQEFSCAGRVVCPNLQSPRKSLQAWQ